MSRDFSAQGDVLPTWLPSRFAGYTSGLLAAVSRAGNGRLGEKMEADVSTGL